MKYSYLESRSHRVNMSFIKHTIKFSTFKKKFHSALRNRVSNWAFGSRRTKLGILFFQSYCLLLYLEFWATEIKGWRLKILQKFLGP